MDKLILSQYLDACQLVEETQAELHRLEEEYDNHAVDVVRGSNAEFPYQPMTFHVEGISIDPYKLDKEHQRLKGVLEERLLKASSLKVDVEVWLNTIPMRMSRIVKMKYLQGLTWDTVSAKMGMGTKDAARKAFERFMTEQ